jgi:transmembrane sensor
MPGPPKPPFEIPPLPDQAADPLMWEALAWLVHIHSGDAKAEDGAAFETWQNWSEAHRLAAARARTMWEQLGPTLKPPRKPLPKLPVILVAAIGLAALAFMAGIFGPVASFFADYKSSTGEVRSVVLRDGSEIDLDTGTTFDVSDGDRTITLYTGQIHVKVKPGLPVPFTVVAGPARAQALGTAFAVRRDGSGETVVVTESVVRVSTSGSVAPQAVDILAGQSVSRSNKAGLGTPYTADIATLLAWRRGELRFAGHSLGEVVAELDRYRPGKIIVIGANISSLPVSGNAEISDIDGFLSSLERALPVKVFRVPGFVTIVATPRYGRR